MGEEIFFIFFTPSQLFGKEEAVGGGGGGAMWQVVSINHNLLKGEEIRSKQNGTEVLRLIFASLAPRPTPAHILREAKCDRLYITVWRSGICNTVCRTSG